MKTQKELNKVLLQELKETKSKLECKIRIK